MENMTNNSNLDMPSVPAAAPTRHSWPVSLFRGIVHLINIAVLGIGSLFTILCFAGAAAASTGAGFFGCGDGIPDPQGAQEATSAGVVSAIVTLGIFVGILAVMRATRSESQRAR